jgi:hypothetical protein
MPAGRDEKELNDETESIRMLVVRFSYWFVALEEE